MKCKWIPDGFWVCPGVSTYSCEEYLTLQILNAPPAYIWLCLPFGAAAGSKQGVYRCIFGKNSCLLQLEMGSLSAVRVNQNSKVTSCKTKTMRRMMLKKLSTSWGIAELGDFYLWGYQNKQPFHITFVPLFILKKIKLFSFKICISGR